MSRPAKPTVADRLRGIVALGTFAAAVPMGDDGLPATEFKIFQAGENTSTKGTFVFDEEAAASVMAAFGRKAHTLTMDYEHQALLSEKNGQPAPASAYSWVPQVRNGELWATDVKWTARALKYLADKEYLYFSPLFNNDKSGRVLEVFNLALTNIPALDHVEPLIAASAAAIEPGARTMKKLTCLKCTKALKAPTDEDDGDDVMCSACGGAQGAVATATVSALSIAVGLKADAGGGEVQAGVNALVALRADLRTATGIDDTAKMIGTILSWKAAATELTALKAQVEASAQTGRNEEFKRLLDGAVGDKKIAPAFRTDFWEKTYAPGGNATEAGLTALRAFLPGAVAQRQDGPNPPPPVKTAVGGDEAEMYRRMGIDPAALAVWKAKQAQGGAQ